MNLRLPFLALVLALLAVAGPSFSAEPEKTVEVILDFGDGSEKRFTQIPWKAESTVFAATEAASRHPRGFDLKSRGSGDTRFVYAIDDLPNEGNGRNWIFRVNDKLATRSCELVELSPGDVILWRFQQYR